jgi:hypothetical protein
MALLNRPHRPKNRLHQTNPRKTTRLHQHPITGRHRQPATRRRDSVFN